MCRNFDSTFPYHFSSSLCTYHIMHQSYTVHNVPSLRQGRQHIPLSLFSFALRIPYYAPVIDSTLRTVTSTVHSPITFRLRSAHNYQTSRALWYSSEKLLKIPKRNFKSFSERSFNFLAPSVWNSLPAGLRNIPTLSGFKTQLKTFLFRHVVVTNLRRLFLWQQIMCICLHVYKCVNGVC